MSKSNAPSLRQLDEILFDVATIIELNDTDRKAAESRYRKLKEVLSKSGSVFAPLLEHEDAKIYAQGSMASSTTIVSGTDDDRFDVDAIVEVQVPADWSPKEALDNLHESLKDFPHAKGVERCTRCVQIKFANMHMDVTVLDNKNRKSGERPGEIAHSPDEGESYMVPSNPYGFTTWFRRSVSTVEQNTALILNKRREQFSYSRIQLSEDELSLLKSAEQEDLAPFLPARIDAQEVVALKLLKRYLNLKYESERKAKRPPSIYLTKVVGDIGYFSEGLAFQLFKLSEQLSHEMDFHLTQNSRPNHVNPSYEADLINDRWPREDYEELDMKFFKTKLDDLTAGIKALSSASLKEAKSIIAELFGERVSESALEILVKNFDARDKEANLHAAFPTGEVLTESSIQPKANVESPPSHRFHCSMAEKKDV